jgi:poly(A) polymerase
MDSERMWGVTPPISVSFPTESEKKLNEALFQELRRQGTFESAAETQKRQQVLASLQKICDAFVKKVAEKKEPNNPVLIRDARGKIFTYGSYRLGVYGPGSDIDTLVVAPRYVDRDDYFKYFPDLLVEMAPFGAIANLSVVREAFVPIIKFEYSGISIDLIFSRIATLKQLPADKEWGLKDNNLLRGLDERELRSLNGTRVTDEIMDLVPEPTTFRLALRAIKLWAQRRAIYANIMGYPGGVAWAMMVARVCQLYPKAASAVIVNKFFHIIARWPWPQPVLLKHIEDGPLQVRIWNPKNYPGDKYHLMPIITPAYPSMCSTFNITQSAKTVILRELERAAQISDAIMVGQRPWKDLFTKHTFFTQDFKYYINVISTSKTKEAHKVWSGYVESKVRLLVHGLERHPSIAIARPFNKAFDRVHRCKNDAEIEQVQNGSLAFVSKEKPDIAESKIKVELQPAQADAANGQPAKPVLETANVKAVDETSAEIKPEPAEDASTNLHALPAHTSPTKIKQEAAENGATANRDHDKTQPIKAETAAAEIKKEDVPQNEGMEIWTSCHYIGLTLAEGAKSLDLSYQVDEFKDLCRRWDQFDVHLNSLNVVHVRNTTLPDDVFEPGEVKPSKPLKKRVANGDPAQRKRIATEDGPNPAKRQQTTAVNPAVAS